MDPLSQAALGAAAAVALSRGRDVRVAALIGSVAGAAPDIDVLIRSAEDPLVALAYHRHFTHALVFAPVLGMAVAAVFKLLFFQKTPPFRQLTVFAVAAALTHGVLDACTSYGTLLYWPFSNHRESWDIISIIDPLFTMPLVGLLALAAVREKPWIARCALGFCLLYLCAGMVQRERAEQFAAQLAERRGHVPAELTARPSIGNLLLWRIVYRDGRDYFVDAVQLGPLGAPFHYPGARVVAFDRKDVILQAGEGSVLAGDLKRFDHFSQGYLYRHPGQSDVVGDLRYALFPDSVIPLWGVRIDPRNPDQHVALESFRRAEDGALKRLWTMICGRALDE